MIKGTTEACCKDMCQAHYKRYRKTGVIGGAIKAYVTVLSVLRNFKFPRRLSTKDF